MLNEVKLNRNIMLSEISRKILTDLLNRISSNETANVRIIVALFHKSLDLFDSILTLQKLEQMETAQALVRCIFEVNLKFGELITITDEKGKQYASGLVADSLMLIKARDALEQGALSEDDKDFKQAIEQIKAKYNKTELASIKKYGFIMMQLDQLARKDGKIDWYNGMYRSFSRNIHSHDLTEYLVKQNGLNTPELLANNSNRDSMSLDCSFMSLQQIVVYVDQIFRLGYSKELNSILQ